MFSYSMQRLILLVGHTNWILEISYLTSSELSVLPAQYLFSAKKDYFLMARA